MKKTSLLLSCCALALLGCQNHTQLALGGVKNGGNEIGWDSHDFNYESTIKSGQSLPSKLSTLIPKDKVNNATRALTAEAIVALDNGDLEKASALFNTALRRDLSNSTLHFMNGLTYHLMAEGGNSSKYKFAEQGYEQAYKFDSSNALATYYLGLVYFDQRKFAQAQAAFAVAAVMDEEDPEILYDLARASYFAGDPRTSKAALEKLENMELGPIEKNKLTRAMVLTYAALDMPADAEKLLTKLEDAPKTHAFLEKRVAAWGRTYKEAAFAPVQQAVLKTDDVRGKIHLAQALPRGPRVPGIPGATFGDEGFDGDIETNVQSDFINDEMVVVDVVIIRTQEDVSSNRGLNLLSGLQLQFGDPLTNTPGLSAAFNESDDRTASGADTKTSTLSGLISIPSVNYSLNIFNTLDGRNEILASPSLVALANEKSEFFSGVDVVAAAVSGGDGSSISVNKKIGVKLSVVPEFLPGDRIKLEVQAERTFLTTPSSSVNFQFRLDTSNTNVNANVVMKFGETLILSGLSEKELESTRDQVPLLGDVPVVQYLFSKQAKRDFRKSVLIMLTPRRAQYVNRSREDREQAEAALSDYEKSLSTFEARNKDWFIPPSTTKEVLIATGTNTLFQEFKTGDFKMENWHSRSTHGKRLSRAVDFLFY